MPDREADAEKEVLIQGYVEGALTPEESVRLHELVRRDPLLARVIAQSLRMDGAIREVTTGKELAESTPREEVSDITPRRGTRRVLSTRRTRVHAFGGGQLPPQFAVIFAAACVLLVIGLLFTASQPSGVEVAQKKSNGARQEKLRRIAQEERSARDRQQFAAQRLRENDRLREALTPKQPQAIPDSEKRKAELLSLETERKNIERELQEAINKELSAKAETIEIEDPPFE